MSDEIDVRDDVVTGTLEETGDQKDLPMVRRMMQKLAMEASVDSADLADDFVMQLLEGILNAESVEEIFESQSNGMVSGKDFAGRPFYLSSENIQVKRTAFTDGAGLPFYFILKVITIDTGEEIILSCGGKTFMAALEALRNLDYFDVTEEYPLGRSIVLQSHNAPAGAYLTIAPYRVPAAPATKTRKSAK
jgi:hypothetical protein